MTHAAQTLDHSYNCVATSSIAVLLCCIIYLVALGKKSGLLRAKQQSLARQTDAACVAVHCRRVDARRFVLAVAPVQPPAYDEQCLLKTDTLA